MKSVFVSAGFILAAAAMLPAAAQTSPAADAAWIESQVSALRAEVTHRAAAALPPIAGLVERVGAGRWTCVAVVPDGADPHTWAPSPRQLASFSGVKLMFGSGMPFENALVKRLVQRSLLLPGGRRFMEAVELGDGDHDEDDDHAHDHAHAAHAHDHAHDHGGDPHGWLSTKRLREWSRTVSDALRSRDPDVEKFAPLYDEALADFQAEVRALEDEIRSKIPEGTSFGAVHAAFGPFAEAFGLRQIALETEGREPGPRALAAAAAALGETGARVLLVQNDAEARLAAPFAAKSGARIVRVRLLGSDPLETIRQVAEAIAGGGAAAAR